MDEIAIMVILGPMLIAIATKFGVDPIHFGAIIVTNVAIGMAAPPIGYCLFVGMAISGLSLSPDIARNLAAYPGDADRAVPDDLHSVVRADVRAGQVSDIR